MSALSDLLTGQIAKGSARARSPGTRSHSDTAQTRHAARYLRGDHGRPDEVTW